MILTQHTNANLIRLPAGAVLLHASHRPMAGMPDWSPAKRRPGTRSGERRSLPCR